MSSSDHRIFAPHQTTLRQSGQQALLASPDLPGKLPFVARCLLGLFGLGLLAAGPAVAAEATATPLQHRLLNSLDTPVLPNLGGWMVDDITARSAAGVAPRLGTGVIEITGTSKTAGGKVDVTVFNGALTGCRRLSLWVAPGEAANVASVGFQVVDAKGEWLLQTVPVDWTGWKQVALDPTAGGMRQAYPQKDHDGKVDWPLRSVHLVWFTKQSGPTALQVNALTAHTEAASEAGVVLNRLGTDVLEPGQPLHLRWLAENRTATAQKVAVRFSLQTNPQYADPAVPDPVLGYDHALGATNTVVVDGVDKGDARLCDGDEFSGFEMPWGSGYREAVATLDLRQARAVRAVYWQGGDANWMFQADIAVSLDGAVFEPVAGAQGLDLHGKWGGPHAFSWPKPVTARFLRFRFHKDGQPVNRICLPSSILVYDGIENDPVTVPQVGELVASGSTEVTVPARDFSELSLRGSAALSPGAYLLGLEVSLAGRKEPRWSHLFVLPTDTVAPDRARRFGINASAPQAWYAANLRRCGFGWVRFENAKWNMYMPGRDTAAFDGSVAPWHINLNQIFAQYQQHGLRVLPYVFQPPEWATSAPANVQKNRAGYPPKDPADYGDAVFQLVARFGRTRVEAARLKTADKQSGLGLMDAVELWNEPNLNDPTWGPFAGTMPQYFEVMRAGVEGARRADPTLPVSAAGLAGIDLEIVGQLAEYHYADGKTPLDLVDIVNVHFYSGREEPELAGWDPNVSRNGPSATGTTYPEQLEDLVAWRDQLKPKAELWMTEIGNDVGGPIGRSERHQAAKVPRGMLLALAAGVERVFIYRESGSDPAMHAGAGLLRNDGSTRPAWLTVAIMIRQLQGFNGRALRLPSADPKTWLLLWQEGERRLLTAWTLDESTQLGIELGKAQVCDSFGRAKTVDGTAGIMLGYFPTYITLAGPTAALQNLVAKARSQAEERAAVRRRLAAVPMQLFDFGPSNHVGMLKGYGLPRRFTPVGKDRLWDAQRGYGFAAAAVEEVDRHWIGDALERDSVRIAAGNPFRLRLDPGQQCLRVRADAFDGQQPIEVQVKAAGVTEKRVIAKGASIAEFSLAGGGDPIEVSLGAPGFLRWLTAIPQSAVNPALAGDQPERDRQAH